MNTMKKIVVFSSILFLAGGLLIGCDREEQAVLDQPQEREEAATEQTEAQEQAATDMEQRETEPLEEREDATSAEIRGETERMAAGRTGEQSGGGMAGGTQGGQGLIGKTVMSSDDQELGEVAQLEATGQQTGYIFIQGEDDRLHPVPANLLEDSPQEGLRAKFDRSAFEQSPSFSESEVRNISVSQLEEVRGYYEERANQ